MVNREPYATSPAQLSEELNLPLLGQFEPESRFLERPGHLGDFALDPMRSAHIYHAILDALGKPSGPPVLWIASLPGSWEQAPSAVGLAETACTINEGAILAQVADMHLPAPAGAVERLDGAVQSFVDNLMGRPMQFWSSDLSGVCRALPAPDTDDPIPTLNLPDGDPEKGDRAVFVLSPVEEEGWNPPSHIVDGALLVVSYRDHPLSHILWAKERILSAGHQLVGLVAAGPADDSKEAAAPPPAKSKAVPPPPPPPPSPSLSPPAGPGAGPERQPGEPADRNASSPPGPPKPGPAPPEGKQIPKPPSRKPPPPPRGPADPESVVRVDWATRFSSEASATKRFARKAIRAWPWVLVIALVGGFAYTKLKPVLFPPSDDGALAGDSALVAADSALADPYSAAVEEMTAAVVIPDETPERAVDSAESAREEEAANAITGDSAPRQSRTEDQAGDPRGNQPESRPEGQREGQPESHPQDQPESQPESHPQDQPESHPQDQPESHPQDQPESHPEVRSEDQPEVQAAKVPERERDWEALDSEVQREDGWAAGEDRTRELEDREVQPAATPAVVPEAEDRSDETVGAGEAPSEGVPVDFPGREDNQERDQTPEPNNISENQIPGLDPSLYPLTVQVAAFQSGDGALFEVDRLDALGYPADTLWVNIPEKGPYCRVVTGTFRNSEAALLLVKELQRHPDVGQAFIVTRSGRGKILWSLSHR